MSKELQYGIDPASPDGDMTAISIKVDNKLFTFTGEEAEAIIAYAEQRERIAEVRAYRNASLRMIDRMFDVDREKRSEAVHAAQTIIKQLEMTPELAALKETTK